MNGNNIDNTRMQFDSKTVVFGFEEAKDWVLLANHVDVFVNGKYKGVYTLGQQVE